MYNSLFLSQCFLLNVFCPVRFNKKHVLFLSFLSFLLLAAEPAKIVDKPDALSVTAGDIAALEVKVCGTPELVPKWFKDGVELASGRKYKISFSRMISSLNVLSAEKIDSGEYTFQIMNEVGKDLSKINLTVLGWCSSYL